MAQRLAVDGLWLCLRPSIAQSLTKGISNGLPRNKPPILQLKPCYLPRSTVVTVADNAPVTENGDGADDAAAAAAAAGEDGIFTVPIRRSPVGGHLNSPETHRRKVRPDEVHPSEWIPRSTISERFLTESTTSTLEGALSRAGQKPVSYVNTMRVIRELIYVRGMQPAPRHYKAAIDANLDSYRGSASQVRKLLEDMDANKIVADSGTLHAALQVLAVHPDYILRQEVLQRLRERWISLSPAGWHSVITGYVREGQFEMALKSLSHLETQDIHVADWLYGLLIYNLCDVKEFDEALRLMKARLGQGYNFSPNMWYNVLDLASEALHEETINFIWRRRVSTGYLCASYGMCNNALTIASRSGNVELATSVFKVLEDRKATLSRNDYEALVDTFAAAGDVMSAFRILCVMRNMGVAATESATPSILSALFQQKTNPLDAWAMLQRLGGEEKREVPIAAANAVLTLCVRQSDAEAAMTIYRELHLVCSESASTETFNILVLVCNRARRLDMASFFLADMRQFNILPNATTYVRLIDLCLLAERFTEARNYLHEMAQSGFELPAGLRQKFSQYVAGSASDGAREFRLSLSVIRATPRRDRSIKQNGISTRPVSGQSLPGAAALNPEPENPEPHAPEQDSLDNVTVEKDAVRELEGGSLLGFDSVAVEEDIQLEPEPSGPAAGDRISGSQLEENPQAGK